MSQIAPSSGSVPSTASQVAAITGVIVELPPGVIRSNLAMLLIGTVIGRDAHGLTLVESGQGVLGLRLSTQPPTGAQLTMQVQSAGAQLHVAVVASSPPPRAAAPTAATIEATLLGPRPNPATESSVSAGRAAAAPTSYSVRVLTQPNAAAPIASQLPAIVAGRAANGHTLVDTPAGRFSLPLASPPPPGVKLVLQSTAAPFPTAAPSAAAESHALVPSIPSAAGSAGQGLGAAQAAQAPRTAQPAPAAQAVAAQASVAAVVITQEAALPSTPATATLRSPSAVYPVAPSTDPQSSSRPSPATTEVANAPRTMPTSLPSPAVTGSAAPQAGAVVALATPNTAARQALVATDPATPPTAKLAAPGGPPPFPATPRPSSPAPSAIPRAEASPDHRAMLLPMAAARSAPAVATPIMVRVLAVATPTHPTMAADARAASAPAARPSPSSSSPAAARQFTAVVTGSAPNGDTIVESPLGRITIALPKPLPAGQELALQLIAEERPPAAPTQGQASLTALSRGWPNLKSALEAREQPGAGTARPILDAIPQPGPKLAQQMLAFFSALDSGDVRSWLSERAHTLERAAGPGIIAGLDADLAEMKTATAGNGDWRVAFLPFFDGASLQQIRIYSRRHRSGGGREDDPGDRFLLEFEISELGPLQVDGLLHKPRCDVILRSQVVLPDWLRAELVRLYADSISATGLVGELSFQVKRGFPTPALDEPAADGVGVVV